MATVCLTLEELKSAECSVPVTTRPDTAKPEAVGLYDLFGWMMLIGIVMGLGGVFGYSVGQSKEKNATYLLSKENQLQGLASAVVLNGRLWV